MHIKFILVILIPLVVSISTIPGLPFDLFQEAEAKKSAGMDTPGRLDVKSYGSKNNGIVCGDRLCSELTSETTTTQVTSVIFTDQYIIQQVRKELGLSIDLSGKNLYGQDINHLDLRFANLSYTNLRGANLQGVDLTGADLRFSNLYNANLDGAILKNADLSHTNFLRAYLRNSDLSNANLNHVNFYLADLTSANLANANLQNANLFMANFAGTNLDNANMVGAGTGKTNLNDCINHPICKWTN